MLMNFCLITGRTSNQGEAREIGKATREYRDNTALVHANDEDMSDLGLEEGSTVEVITDSGSVVVRVQEDDGLDRGMLFMPIGPWANKIVGGDTGGTGSSFAKGISADLEPADEDVKDLEELLEEY